MLTRQEIFTQVVTHLRKQGKRAQVPLGDAMQCRYRTPDNQKCAAGCLIQDKFYSGQLEGLCAGSAKVTAALINSGVSSDDMNMVLALQQIHDERPFSSWEGAWEAIAMYEGLTMPEVM